MGFDTRPALPAEGICVLHVALAVLGGVRLFLVGELQHSDGKGCPWLGVSLWGKHRLGYGRKQEGMDWRGLEGTGDIPGVSGPLHKFLNSLSPAAGTEHCWVSPSRFSLLTCHSLI